MHVLEREKNAHCLSEQKNDVQCARTKKVLRTRYRSRLESSMVIFPLHFSRSEIGIIFSSQIVPNSWKLALFALKRVLLCCYSPTVFFWEERKKKTRIWFSFFSIVLLSNESGFFPENLRWPVAHCIELENIFFEKTLW